MDSKNWLLENITKYNNRINFLKDCMEATGIAQRTAQQYYKELFLPCNNQPGNPVIENNNPEFSDLIPGSEPDAEIVEENTRLSKKLQKNVDKNRIERKSFREHARIENALEEMDKKITELLEEKSFHISTYSHDGDEDCALVVQLSDLHLNELIDLKNNQFDFPKASQRLKLFADRIIKYSSAFNIQNLFIAMTGDLMNNQKRLDEYLNCASNRSKAVFLAVDLLQQFITDLNKYFNITIGSVTGNESRKTEEIGFTDLVVSDNYDFTIFNMLRWLFVDKPGVDFISGDPYELVVNVAGKNILLMHGYNIKGKTEETVSKIKGRYADKGITIDYVLFGHLHSTRIGDTYGRSSSLCGANTYSERNLNLSSRAAQNIYIVYNDGNMDGIKVDLQNADGEGYDIDSSLEAYDAKSSSKTHQQETIYRITV